MWVSNHLDITDDAKKLKKYIMHLKSKLTYRAYPENTNFETLVSRNLKSHTFGDLHTTKNAENFKLIL